MKTLFGFVVLALLIFAGCKSEKGPGETLEEYLNAMQAGNYESFVGGLSYPGFAGVNADSLTIHLMEANKQLLEERYDGVKSYEIVKVTLDEQGTTATVRVKINFGNDSSEETECEMIKEDDGWKINLAV